MPVPVTPSKSSVGGGFFANLEEDISCHVNIEVERAGCGPGEAENILA